MNIFKKILSLSMVFLLIFSCIPLSAFAEEATTEVITESMSEETSSEDSPVLEAPLLETVMNPAEESGEEPESGTEIAEESSPESIPEEPTEESIIPEDNASDVTVDENSLEDIPSETTKASPEAENTEELPAEEQPSDILPVEEVSENEPETAEDPDEKTIEELIEEEPSEESVDEEPIPCNLTVELMDVRDSIVIRKNGETVASVFGNYAPGSGSYYLVCPNRLEPLAVDADGVTRLTIEAMTGDGISVDVGEPGYASVDFKSAEELNTAHSNGLGICSLIMTGNTVITINGDYSAADGYFSIGGRKVRLMARGGSWTPPDAMYVSLGSCYSDYSSSAIVNGHTGVYFFQPEEQGEGHFVSATCGSTTKHMVSGVHYKVARIAELAARPYLDYGSGCCSQRAQRALAWITHHGQSEYDWRRYNENKFVMGDGQIYVSNQLEAYTITFLAAWVCTNDGRVGSYGTVHAEDGAHALDFMFGSSFSNGLPSSTKNAIDQMVAMGLAFADAHPNQDENVPEYQESFVYSDGNGAHQPLLIGAYQGERNGSVQIKKVSSVPQYTDNNKMYSFEGTTFEIRDNDGAVAGTLVADASGNTSSLELPAGTYKVTETKVGKGYVRNTETKTVTIESGETASVTFANDPIPDPATMYLYKWDSETDRAISQGNGTLKGAQYRFDYYDNTNWSGTPKASWVFETDEQGRIRYLPEFKVSGPDMYSFKGVYLLPLGSLKITEVKAPQGYRMSTAELKATMTQDGNLGILKWTTETQALIKAYKDGWIIEEDVIRGGVRFKKVDSETAKPVAGAEISIYNNSDNEVLVDGTLYKKGDKIITLISDDNGFCQTGEDYLPYGSYYAVETKPSEGYLLNKDWRVDFKIISDKTVVDCTTGKNLLKEQIIRGDLAMLKLDIDGNYKPNIPFMVVQIDKDGNEGEWHVIVTDENGRIDTSSASRKHTNKTNSLDQYIDGGVFTDTAKLDPTVGIWFGESDPNDSLGALPFGSYKVYELQTEQLKNEQINILESKIIQVTEPGTVIELTPMVNLNIDLTSNAASANGQDFIPAAENVLVQDTVYYTNLTSNRRYTMETQFVLKSDVSAVLATVSKDFYPPEGPSGTNTAKGEVTLEAVINTKDYSGDSVVAFDYLYEYVKGTKVLVASHTDIEDKAQTLRIPSISTMARDKDTGDNVGTVSEKAKIIDTVKYVNLKRGEIFKLVAKLVDSETEEYLKDTNGNDLIVEKRFMCGLQDDSVEMPAFEIDSREYQGKSVVVVEELYWIDEEHDNTEVLMTTHESPDDKDQTITYPEVHTSASDSQTEDHVGSVSEETTIADEVHLKGLIIGKEYTVTGKLVYRNEFVDKDNKLHKAGDSVAVKDSSLKEVTFTAEAEEMTVTLKYVVDSRNLEGTTAVVFEDLIHNGVKVASHADLNDKEQTVHFPKLKTQAIDKTSGTSFVTKGSEVYFVDTVSYSNVVPGLTYIVRGELMDKNTGESLHAYAVSDVFTPGAANGTVQMEFLVDSERIPSTVIVVFEDLYLVKEDGTEVLIEQHEDLNDEDQSLYHPEIGTTAVNAETATHEAQGKTKTILTDTVTYKNLKPGQEYTIAGTLMDKATGDPIVIGGNRVTAKTTFTPAEKDGSVEVIFEFDASGLVGKTTVAFERLVYEGLEIAVHADIEDEDQSVNIIDIRTSAVEKESGSHTATHSHTATVIDTITYKGLTPGKKYTVYGTVMVKGTEAELYQNGIPITGMTEFIPTAANGTVEVTFVVDTYQLQGMEIVVFERLFAGSVTGSTLESDVPIAIHEDINDTNQTIKVPVIPFTPPHTGVDDHMGLLLTAMLSSGAGAIWILKKRKRS
ncbi:MAG: VaFE repeat-containing surface-anchored protein [Oscillospiraceae bacterium]|nr:VaFE repeat-containing surface-anchored protein [Oscillospiraceae bacterium]